MWGGSGGGGVGPLLFIFFVKFFLTMLAASCVLCFFVLVLALLLSLFFCVCVSKSDLCCVLCVLGFNSSFLFKLRKNYFLFKKCNMFFFFSLSLSLSLCSLLTKKKENSSFTQKPVTLMLPPKSTRKVYIYYLMIMYLLL